MSRAAFSLLLALAAVFPRTATAQKSRDFDDSRAPRFLLAMAGRSEPVPVDLRRSTTLRYPLSLAFDGVTLKEALAEISRQARLSLVYADDVVPVDATVNLRAERITVAAALTEVLLDAGVDVVFTPDGRATLVKRPEGPALQFGSIAGTVTAAEANTPLTRAVVSVAGTHLTTETDASGRYTITNVPVGTHRLRARMLGYAPVDTSVTVEEGQEAVMNFQLKAQAIQLEAVVAVGYGEKRREDLTGAVGTVTSQVLEARPITNTMAALQGVMPGLIVQRNGGQPGVEDFNLNLRGVSSANPADTGNAANTPLVLIDGVPGRLDLLNPADIESITALKDAAASIYGARAADGALLVTTKRGTRTAPVFTYSNNTAVSHLTGMMETPNNYQMALMDNEANIHAGQTPMYTPDLLNRVKIGDPTPIPHPIYGSSGWMLFFTNTDWRKALFENGSEQKHTLSVSGGGQNSSYYVSASYANQDGVIRYANDNNKRYQLRLNYDYDFSRRVRLESRLAVENQDRSDIGGLSHGSWCSCPWVVVEGIFGMPNHPVYTESGQHFFAQGGWGNAVAQAKEAATATFGTRAVNTNFKLIFEPVDGLKLNLQSGINYRSDDNTDIGKSYAYYQWNDSNIAYYSTPPDQNWVERYDAATVHRNYVGYAEFRRTFADQHAVEIMGGVSHEDDDVDWVRAGRYGFTSQDVWGLNLGSTANMWTGGGGQQWAIRSVFSRLSYGFRNKYLLDATLRYDGSSRFAPEHRWGFFPGVSLAWRLSEEPFVRRRLGAVDDLKLRVSYGRNGNQEGINLYDYLQLISIGRKWPYDPYYPLGPGRPEQSAYLSGMVATNRTWETIAMTNVGLDATLLSSRLDVTFDYFVKRNNDMLIPVTYPSLLGATPPFSNAGNLKTWGFETSVAWRGAARGLQYSARLTLSDAQNKVVNYGGQDTYVLGLNAVWDGHIREGYPINTYFGYVFDGLIRTQAELDAYKLLGGVPSDIGIGDARYKDVNGDGKISLYGDTPGDDGDVVNLGNTAPRYTYGLNLNASWKRLDLGVFFQGVGKRTLFREGEYRMPWSDWWRQPPLFYFNETWNEDRPNAPYPRLSHGNIRFWNYQPSSLQRINGAYLRLKNLQIGFTLPERLIARARMTHARVYFSGFDLWEKHSVKGGWDPESPALGFNYPFQRLYSFGMDITF
jgi:TonB-linked SusC/RagA family outer membrane protein